MPTNPRSVGSVAVVLVALLAGAGAVAAIATVQPAPAAVSDRPPSTSSRSGAVERRPRMAPPLDVVAPRDTIGANWCAAGELSIEIEGTDAATGHREAVLRAVNVGSAPCVLDGYPDIAIADADGGEVPLEIVQGSSFMATDPMPSAITIPVGGGAASVLGWDTTDGRTAISAVHVAAYPGVPRVALAASWDMTGSTRIAVTAWQHD